MRWPWRREERALPAGAYLTAAGGSGAQTWALGPLGGTVDTDAAMRHTAVWACVRLLADTVSTLPVDVYRRGEAEPLATPPLLVEPAAGTPRTDWLYAAMASLLLRGNAYGLVTARSGATLLPSQVELVHPDLVSVFVDPETQAVTYRIGGQAYGRTDVLHVRAYAMPGVLLGLSPVEYARQAIGLGLAAEKFGAQYFGDGAMPQGVLEAEGNISSEMAHALSARWESAHGGARKVAVLSGAKFVPITVKPEESQFIETQRLNVASIARVFGVPPEMIGAEAGNSLTYANVEGRALDLLKYAVNPWLVRLENALGTLLPRNQYVKFNADGLLRTDTKTRYEAHKIGLDAGFLTVNEVRALEDLPPLVEPAPPATEQTGGAVA